MNKKGITILEVLVCFVLISIILIGIMNVVFSYRGKIGDSNYKTQMTEYKNNLTKDIYSDILRIGVKECKLVDNRTVKITFMDNTTKDIVISDNSTNVGLRNKYITYGGRIYKIQESLPQNVSNIKDYQMILMPSKIVFIEDDLGDNKVYHIDINIYYVDSVKDYGIHLTFTKKMKSDFVK